MNGSSSSVSSRRRFCRLQLDEGRARCSSCRRMRGAPGAAAAGWGVGDSTACVDATVTSPAAAIAALSLSSAAHRSDAAQWPGGGVSAYLARLQQEVLPWVASEYGASLAPADLALAGSSFGGVAALCAGMSGAVSEAGCAFGALLVESPSMWIANEGFMRVSGGGGECLCEGKGGTQQLGGLRGASCNVRVSPWACAAGVAAAGLRR
jgi:hypothetical protein